MASSVIRTALVSAAIALVTGVVSCWNDSTGPKGPNVYPITGLLLDPDSCAVDAQDRVDCSTIIAASDGGGIFRSLDGGENWSQSDGILDFNITDMVIDPSDSDFLYAGTENSGLFRSFNGGSTWDTAIPSISEITDIAIDANSCQSPPCTDIYVASLETGVWVTENGGLTWTQMNDGLEETAITAIEVFSYNSFPSRFYVGTEEGEIYKLNVIPGQWEKLLPGLGEITNASPLKIAVNPIVDTEIYVGTSGGEGEFQGGLFRSVDGGQNWERVPSIPNDQGFSVRVVVFCIQEEPQCSPVTPDPNGEQAKDERPPNTIYAGIFGLSKALLPQAVDWENIDLGGEIQQGNNSSAIAFDPIRHTAIYVGTREGFIMKSLDSGETWERLDPEF